MQPTTAAAVAYSTYVEEFSHLRLSLILCTAAGSLEPKGTEGRRAMRSSGPLRFAVYQAFICMNKVNARFFPGTFEE